MMAHHCWTSFWKRTKNLMRLIGSPSRRPHPWPALSPTNKYCCHGTVYRAKMILVIRNKR